MQRGVVSPRGPSAGRLLELSSQEARVRVRDHIALSSAAAAALSPLLGRRLRAFWVASIAIDLDHYLWFCLRRQSVSPLRAARFFNGPEPPQHAGTRFLHRWGLPIAGLLGARWSQARTAGLGLAAHIALDAYHERRMRQAKGEALRRDHHTCQGCGAVGDGVGTHLWRQPRLLPSYAPWNHVALCRTCHMAAHDDPRPLGSFAARTTSRAEV